MLGAARAFSPAVDAALEAQAPTDTAVVELPLAGPPERIFSAHVKRLPREMGGTGLGLAIVKHALSRHRGKLEIDSEIGPGATFTVVLPAAPRARERPPDKLSTCRAN